MNPNVFIGSSSESLDIANAIQANLSYYEFYPAVWPQGIFTPSNFPIEDLLKKLEESDFAIFVFTPDDIVKIRNQKLNTVRDNVIFEMGLFIGKLGKERTFFVMPHSNEPLRIASDLFGLKPATFNAKNPDKRAALGVACEEIRTAMEKLGPRYRTPEALLQFAQKVKEDENQIHFYTSCGLQIDKEIDIQRNPIIGLNSVFRLWADPTDQDNLIKATVVLDQEPNFFRIVFKNNPGCYPANVTIRPCGLFPLKNPQHKKFLMLDARAYQAEGDSSNRCSKDIGLSFRLIDNLATQWVKGIIDPLQVHLPVDNKWYTFKLDLTKEWFLFNADGNYYYASKNDNIDFSIIAAIVIEFGSKGGPRLGAGYGQVDLTNIRLSDE